MKERGEKIGKQAPGVGMELNSPVIQRNNVMYVCVCVWLRGIPKGWKDESSGTDIVCLHHAYQLGHKPLLYHDMTGEMGVRWGEQVEGTT